MSHKPDIHWQKKFARGGRIIFTCQDLNEVYVSFDWNGSGVWQYACTAGADDGKRFAKYLRAVADLVEKRP